MKKIVIMGGGLNQIPLIKSSQDLGYHIILCDARDTVPGKSLSDEFIKADIANTETMIEICKTTSADGIVCNTESLMYTLSEIQCHMKYIGNTKNAIQNLSDKLHFRAIQKKSNVFSPNTKKFTDYTSAKDYICTRGEKIIMKPELASGSRGVYTINNAQEFTKEKFDNCAAISRNYSVLIEEFIEFSLSSALEAEVFLIDGAIEKMFLFRTIRDRKHNILPQCYCSDNELNSSTEKQIQEELQRIFTSAGITWGEYNVELAFTPKNEIFVIEINARQGGMMLPEFVHIFSGIDVNKLLVSTSVKDNTYLSLIRNKHYITDKNCIHFRIITDKSGIFESIEIAPELRPYLIKEFYYIQPGSSIAPSNNCYISLGVLDFRFSNNQIRKNFENSIFSMVAVLIN